MAKFIELTDTRRGHIAVNMDTIEVMAPIAAGGTEVISITHHTKYIVKESMDDILRMVRGERTVAEEAEERKDILRRISLDNAIHARRMSDKDPFDVATETLSIMEVENNETKLQTGI